MYHQVVCHQFDTHASDDIIAEADANIARFVKRSNMSQLDFANEHWVKSLSCPHFYGNTTNKFLRESFSTEYRSPLGTVRIVLELP